METMTVPGGVMQTAEGLDGPGNPVDHFVVDFDVAEEGAPQVGEVVHGLQIGAVRVDLACDVGSVGRSLAFSPCGRYLASGGWCGAICLWDIGRGGQVGQLGGYSALTTTTAEEGEDSSSRQLLTGPVVALHFCPSGSGQLAAAGLEGAVRVWNTGTGQLLSQQTAPEGSHTAPTADSASTNGSGGGLLAAHNALSDVYQRNPNRSGREWRQTAETYYSAAGSYEVSRTCLRDAFFTRKTSVLAVQFAHPYMLLAAGPYNQA
nr:unnamed protein product [Spirometra erinaceieuropaei]